MPLFCNAGGQREKDAKGKRTQSLHGNLIKGLTGIAIPKAFGTV